MPKSTIASRGGIGLRAQRVEPHEGFRRVCGCTRKSVVIDAIAGAAAVGVSRVGAEREREIIGVMQRLDHSPKRSPKAKAGACRRREKHQWPAPY